MVYFIVFSCRIYICNLFWGPQSHQCLGKLQHKILIEKIKRFGGTVSSHFDRSTTHVLFPRGEDSLKSTKVRDTVVLASIDWLSDCISERKLVPTAQCQVRSMQLVWVSRKRVPRGLRSAESRKSMRTNGNFKGALGNSSGGDHCAFCINRLCVCNPTFFGPLYGNNELLHWYLCHQPQHN